jgi:hypothetical protein
MAVVISKSAGLNDDLWNENAPLIRRFIMDADTEKSNYDALLGDMFNVSKSNKFAEKNTGLTEFSDFSITGEGGNAVLDDLQETFLKTIEHEELMKKLVITKTMTEDSQVDMIKQKVKNFVRSYKRSRAQFATNLLCIEGAKAAFGGKADLDRTTGDGKGLFAIDHAGKKAGVGTQSNVFTDAFSAENLIKLGNVLRNFKNDSGIKQGYTANKIIIPGDCPEMEEQIKRIIRSELVTGSANNDVNTQRGLWKLVVNPLWEHDAGTNPYIIMSDEANEELMGNMFFDRTDLQMKENVDIDTHNLEYSGRFRMGAGFFNWRHVIMGGAATGSSLNA